MLQQLEGSHQLLSEEYKLYIPALFLALFENGPCTLTIKYWVKI